MTDIDDADDTDADDAAIATAINTALTNFRTAIAGLDDVGTSADNIIGAVSFLKDDGMRLSKNLMTILMTHLSRDRTSLRPQFRSLQKPRMR